MRRYVWILVALAGGFVAGWLVFGGRGGCGGHGGHGAAGDGEEVGVGAADREQVWTCSMHPQIRLPEPGDCPICGMDLIPLAGAGGAGAAGAGEMPDDAMMMSAEAVALAGIQTTVVSRGEAVKQLLLYGVVTPDERLLQSQSAHVEGRIERLLVDFTGGMVRRGQPLATIWSPELVTAQQELLEAARVASSQPSLLAAAREKLRAWRLSDAQIAAIEASGVPSPTIEITSNTDGIVVGKRVSVGDYVPQGGVLFDVASLGRVWVMFDAYEADLAFLRIGDKVDFSLRAMPGRVFSGAISFIDPLLDPATRTARVRVEAANTDGVLKPQMYATGRVSARLTGPRDQIVVPRSAVLWTGTRSIVYVVKEGFDTPVFALREVTLGPSLGNSYVVLEGLEEGEKIVTNGAFTIDSVAQLEGRQSMMNPPANHHHTDHALLRVEGLCAMCKARIEKTALTVAGITSATWSAEDKMLHLNPTAPIAAVSRAVAAAGHDTRTADSKVTDKPLDLAPDEVYNALPACCKYR